MRRRTLLVALAGLAVVGAAGVVVWWPRADRITQENYDRIRPGMSRAEVEAILGPAGDYRSGPTIWVAGISTNCLVVGRVPADWQVDLYPPEPPVPWPTSWLGDAGDVYVTFSREGVATHEFHESRVVPQSPLDNLLWRAKRLRHRWFP
jgi:hypothetical protein